MEQAVLNETLKKWDIAFKRFRADLPLSGSPERSLRRFALEDENDRLYVLEIISSEQIVHRKEIAAALNVLSERGLENIQLYLPSAGNEYIVHDAGNYMQLSPYVGGIELSRPDYIFEEWRGAALARFLLKLKDTACRELPLKHGKPFSIFTFIDGMHKKMLQHDPEIIDRVADIIDYLNISFRDVHNRTSLQFCHGDFHPLNVIWSKNDLAAVIDWEFMGIKPEFYDVANLVGCIGMEDPNGLTGGLVRRFLATLDNAGYLSAPSRKFLPEAVIALRFAWLSVWLKNRDPAMIDLELHYLRLLMDGIADLRYSWGCPAC